MFFNWYSFMVVEFRISCIMVGKLVIARCLMIMCLKFEFGRISHEAGKTVLDGGS